MPAADAVELGVHRRAVARRGISLLDAIPVIGNKLHATDTFGPEGQKAVATGQFNRTVHFRFTA